MDRQTSEKSAAGKEEERIAREKARKAADEDDEKTHPLRPFAVPVKKALRMLGDKSRSQFYEEAANGEYELLKDGTKTLVTVNSIERHNANLPPAKIGKRGVA